MQIYSSQGQAMLAGGAGNDSFELYRGKGTQEIDGGGGVDTLQLSSHFSAYRLERAADGSVQLHIGEERVTLRDIEQLQFGNETLSLEQALRPAQGTAGDDLAPLFGKQALFDGGAGVDTARIDAYLLHQEVSFAHDAASGRWTVKTASQTLQLDGVEILQFHDLRLDLREVGGTLLQPTRRAAGEGDDDLLDNDLALSLYGGKGNDRLEGRGGDDELSGGIGEDLAVYRGALSEYVIELDTRTGEAWVRDTVAGRDGRDALTSIEQLQFADGRVTLEAVARKFSSPAPEGIHGDLTDGGFLDWVFATAEPVLVPLVGVPDHGVEGAGDFQLPL